MPTDCNLKVIILTAMEYMREDINDMEHSTGKIVVNEKILALFIWWVWYEWKQRRCFGTRQHGEWGHSGFVWAVYQRGKKQSQLAQVVQDHRSFISFVFWVTISCALSQSLWLNQIGHLLFNACNYGNKICQMKVIIVIIFFREEGTTRHCFCGCIAVHWTSKHSLFSEVKM